MKQFNMFGQELKESKYTSKINAPVYTPRGIKPHILELIDVRRSMHFIKEIENSNVSEDEKSFLIKSAHRHDVFNYELIADYYSNTTKEMQYLMEKSALVIIDFDKAIEYGYVQLCEDIKKLYLEEYNNE
jgi:hypothetical protein